jgi:hypothetical protein
MVNLRLKLAAILAALGKARRVQNAARVHRARKNPTPSTA